MKVMQHAIAHNELAQLAELYVENEAPAIYFLMKGEEVVYVGKTKRIRSRVAEHAKEKSGLFDFVRYFHVEDSEMCASEIANIIAFNPPLNGNALDVRDMGYVAVNTALASYKNRPKKSKIITAIKSESDDWLEFRGSVYADRRLIDRIVNELTGEEK